VRHPCHYARFNRRLEEGLGTSANAPPGSLACTARGKANPARAEGTATIQPVSQAAFWCFVLKDAVELHTVRTLALIASASSAFRERLMIEVGGVPHDPERFPAFAMPLLEGCIREQLRLWTPVPVLPRSVVQDFEFDGTPVRQGQQILLHPGFYHRDPEVFGPRADRFCPEQPPDSHGPPVVYSFSRHRQACAGEPLVMLVLKAVLVSLLRRGAVELVEHRIDTDAVPVAIDHFALRFQWRGNEGRVTPAKGA
jgi:hypothetical protein